MIRKNPLTWTKLTDCRDDQSAEGRYSRYEIDSGYALEITAYDITMYTGTTCQGKKRADFLNNQSRVGLAVICYSWKVACLIGRVITCHKLKSGYKQECDLKSRSGV
jgi:hypothetical protein